MVEFGWSMVQQVDNDSSHGGGWEHDVMNDSKGIPKAPALEHDPSRDGHVDTLAIFTEARTKKLDDLPRLARVRWFEVAKKYGFLVPLEGGADHFLHLRDLEDAQAIRVGDVVTYRLAAFNGKTKACRVAKATPAAYAAATLAHEKRTVSLRDAAAEMAKLKDAPLPPKKEGDGGW